jgi:predicted NBD/HSP70 family sugar kinase
VRELAPASRGQIARVTGLSKPTVSQALYSLERARIVREAGRASSRTGPMAVLYEVNPAGGFVVGVDVGRSTVRAALADLTGEVIARHDARARATSADTLIHQVGDISRQVAAEGGVKWRSVVSACVGSPGVLQPGVGHLRLAHNLPGWERQGVVDAIRREIGTRVTIENDVNLATVGEQRRGLGKEVFDYAYLHIGTGAGTGLVLNGQLYRGSSGAAGEVGYLPMAVRDPHGRVSRRPGALESALGASAVMQEARRAGVGSVADAKSVFDAARAGNDAARAVVSTVAQRIALAVAAIAAILDPELVILGGGIGRQGDLLLDPVEQELAALSPFRPRIEASVLGDDAEIQGAVAVAVESAYELLFERMQRRRHNSPRSPTRGVTYSSSSQPRLKGPAS